MKVVKLAAIAAALFSIGSACAQEVHYNYARGTDFSSYKTYRWVNVPGSSSAATPLAPGGGAPRVNLPPDGKLGVLSATAADDTLIAQEIECAVDEQLAQKGLTRVQSNGDILLTYHVAVHEEQAVDLFGSGWGGRGYGGLWEGSVRGQTSTIPVGTLVIDIFDSAKQQLIWRGDASKTVDLKRDPDKNYKDLQKAMMKLFKNYPPRQK